LLVGGFGVPEPQTSHYLLALFSPVGSSNHLSTNSIFYRPLLEITLVFFSRLFVDLKHCIS